MYASFNDNELLYLIKDGNPAAQRMLYYKYEHLILKTLKVYSIRKMMLLDVKQECFLCLDYAIRTYRSNMNCSFYTYFMVIIRRSIQKLYQRKRFLFKEDYMCYGYESTLWEDKRDSKLIKLLYKELKLDGAIEKEIFEKCILQNMKLTELAALYPVKYTTLYAKYKKIKSKIEKILTNLLV